MQVVLDDQKWNRKWIIYDKEITLNIAETVIIDKSNFVYRKYWGLCFIPGAAQFHNFEPVKGAIILTVAGLSIAGYITSYILMQSNVDTMSIFNDYKTAAYSSAVLFGSIYIYSCIDGFVNMEHLYKLFYNNGKNIVKNN